MSIEAQEKEKRIALYAARLLSLACDTVIVSMRFMDAAVGRLRPQKKKGIGCVTSDGDFFYYEPAYVLQQYTVDANSTARMYLHSILHCVFNHSFTGSGLDKRLWNLSCDIAVENMIMELGLSDFRLATDDEREIRLKALKKYIDRMTAEKIYKYFLANPPAASSYPKFEALFRQDVHLYWGESEQYELTEEEWKKISERIRAEIKEFSADSDNSESLMKNLEDASRKKYDYKRILERFCETGEELSVSDEEFDYIYYTYGLEHYDNMPLIEPLEFKDEKKIREFVIVIDTSASCSGKLVRSFLTKTYDILKGSESFFKKINVHIIQCDSEVRSDTHLKTREDFDAFLKEVRLTGNGGTDFRPAFSYVNELSENGEFTNLKGLIYFTDGYGIYPEKKPDYDCIFAFAAGDDMKPAVPWWGIEVILDESIEESGKDEH